MDFSNITHWGVCAGIIGVVSYAIYKERQALGCPNIPDGTDCDNANGKAIKGTLPLVTDPDHIIYNKIKQAADFADRWVTWRLALISSLISTGFIYCFLYSRCPSIKEALVSTFVISAVMYFTFNFYKFHLIDHARNNIIKGVDILTTR